MEGEGRDASAPEPARQTEVDRRREPGCANRRQLIGCDLWLFGENPTNRSLPLVPFPLTTIRRQGARASAPGLKEPGRSKPAPENEAAATAAPALESSEMGKKLYVGNLAFDVTNRDLEDLFAQAGVCESAAVITDRSTGQSRGFGFVEMSSSAEAQRAIQQFDGQDLKGRNLKVNEAREREGGGGGGGGGGRGGWGRR